MFSLTKIIIDTLKKEYDKALTKFMIMILFAVTLNILCERNLTTIAWIIVFLPFVFMSVITLMLVTSDKIISTNVEGWRNKMRNIVKKMKNDAKKIKKAKK
tara:strand:- start:13579 stop:13881 length:303 start_codon:yes stop_codon:yes gene_type:complete